MTDELLILFVALILVGILAVIAWKRPDWGAILAPFASIAGFTAAAILQDVFVAIMALLIWPLMTGIICVEGQKSRLESPWYLTFAILSLKIYTYTLLFIILSYLFNYLSGVFFVLLIIGIVRYTQVCKYSRVLEVVSTINMSMRQSLPLPMALKTAAHGQQYKTANILMRIAHWLTEGCSLSESLRRGFRKCPAGILASIAAAEKMNQLPRVIETIEADISEKINENIRIRPVYPWYPLIVLILVCILVLGLMYFIVPTFAEILSDMSDGTAGLPWITQILLSISNWLKGRNGLNILLLLLLLIFLQIYFWSLRFRKRNPQQPRLLSCVGDWLKWHLPILHWFEMNYSQLQLTEILKTGTRAGYPITLTVRHAMELDMNHCYRRRIRAWLGRIEQGDDLARSAAGCGIGRTIAWALDDTVNKGSAPTILASLEEIYRSRYNYRLNLLNAVICPLMVIGLGGVVGFVVLGMFLPMVKMIQVML